MLQDTLNLQLDDGNKMALEHTSKIYDCGQQRVRYIAEIPLAGKDYLDLSLQCAAALFQNGKNFIPVLNDKYRNGLAEYINILLRKEYDLNNTYFWIEADTSKYNTNSYGFFFPVSDSSLLDLALNFLSPDMQNAVNDVLVKCPKLRKHLKMLGIMFSRENTPVKLNFDIPADVYWDGLKEIQVLLDSVMPMDLCSVVEKLCKDRYMDCSFAVDVFEDGSINPVGAMELSVHEYTVERQNVLIYSPEVSRLWDKLCKYQVVDERYLRLRNITKAKRINFEDAQILYISYLSHIKIRWGKDGLLPVKAYLGADFK